MLTLLTTLPFKKQLCCFCKSNWCTLKKKIKESIRRRLGHPVTYLQTKPLLQDRSTARQPPWATAQSCLRSPRN
jgi:hypothetical protein